MDPFITPILIGLAGKILPGIIGGLAGPQAKTITEAVVAAGQEVFGPAATEATVQATVANNPVALDAFREALDKQIELRRIDLEAFKVQTADVQDARKRDADVRSASGMNARANVMLICAFITLIVVLIGMILYRADIPDGVLAILNMVCGALLAMIGSAFNFEFGSSRGSSEKSDQLTALMKAR